MRTLIILSIYISLVTAAVFKRDTSHQTDKKEKFCDDGKTNLYVDYDGNPSVHTCHTNEVYPVDHNIPPLLTKTETPKKMEVHICMDKNITYNETIPTHGHHRRHWPKYGEYTYLPPQRWLHSLEHGGIVMLYHPCVNATEVELLKETLRCCIKRHIITAFPNLPKERPMALISFGYLYQINYVNVTDAKDYIKNHFRMGFEAKTYYNGLYQYKLIHKAKTVSNATDDVVCPDRPKFLDQSKGDIQTIIEADPVESLSGMHYNPPTTVPTSHS